MTVLYFFVYLYVTGAFHFWPRPGSEMKCTRSLNGTTSVKCDECEPRVWKCCVLCKNAKYLVTLIPYPSISGGPGKYRPRKSIPPSETNTALGPSALGRYWFHRAGLISSGGIFQARPQERYGITMIPIPDGGVGITITKILLCTSDG